MKYLLVIFFLLLCNMVLGQYHICNISAEQQRNSAMVKCLVERGGNNDNKIVREISDMIGLTPNFVFKNCNGIENAVAAINPLDNNQRYIVYDTNYFSRTIKSDYKHIFIIAHEIGHHINGHTIPSNETIEDRQKKELEADYFAGFVLYNVGATENDIIRIIDSFPNPSSHYSSHPQNDMRKIEALKGFNNAFNKHISQMNKYKSYFEYTKEIDLYNEIVRTFYLIPWDSKYLDIAQYLIEELEKNIKNSDKIPLDDIEHMKLNIYTNKKMYKEALPMYEKLLYANNGNVNLENDVLENFLLCLAKSNASPSKYYDLLNRLETSTSAKVQFELGMYYGQTDNVNKRDNAFKKAYELIKNEKDSILKSDIFLHYARTIYDDAVKDFTSLKKRKLNLANTLLVRAIAIQRTYSDSYHRFYYNSTLFHLGNIQMLSKEYSKALDTYFELLEVEKKRGAEARKDYIYKANGSIARIYTELEMYSEAIQYYTNAINHCNDDKTLLGSYYLGRAIAYSRNNTHQLVISDLQKACELGIKEACEILSKSSE